MSMVTALQQLQVLGSIWDRKQLSPLKEKGMGSCRLEVLALRIYVLQVLRSVV